MLLFSATVDGLKIETNKWGKKHLAVIDIIVLIIITVSLVNNISSFKKKWFDTSAKCENLTDKIQT